VRGQDRLVHTMQPAPDRSICITRRLEGHDHEFRKGPEALNLEEIIQELAQIAVPFDLADVC
jgi:hypothetical protein